MPLYQAAQAMNAQWAVAPEIELPPGGASIDSRTVFPGDLFFCVPGERVDGHDYAAQALQKGALAVVAQRPIPEAAGPVLLVEDTVKALGRLAGFWRNKTRARVVGVTGTAGKTTAKEWMAQLLSLDGRTAWNHLNLNNQIGLPLSILRSDGREKYWVLEAGISQRHDMDELGAILRPDLAVILNVGPAHLDGLGDVRGVAECKSKLLGWLTTDGRGLVSRDYPELKEAVWGASPGVERGADVGERYLAFTTKEQESDESPLHLAPYRIRRLGRTESGLIEYRLDLDQDEIIVPLALSGEHMAENIIAAAGCAHMLGMDAETIAQGLALLEPPVQRFQRYTGKGWTLIDDSYNANPLSMAASLAAARDMAGDGPLYLVLGEMRELGAITGEEHLELGRMAARQRPDLLLWRGGQRESLEKGLEQGDFAGELGMLESGEDLVEHFLGRGREPGVVLFKGSRSNELEQCAEALRRELGI